MIPQAGSAYAYSYATLGELVAWIIGWDLILEYAVGNVAVAISWGDYFNTLLRGFGVVLPYWLTTGYRTALLSPDPQVHGLLQSAPHIAGIPILINVPAFAIVMLITWLLLRGARESATANNIMVVIKLLVLSLFVAVGATHLKGANYHPFAPNGFTGIHQGAAIVFFAYIGFDAISTAAEETVNPQRNLPIGILGGLGICTLIYVIVGAVLTGMVPYKELGRGRSAGARAGTGRIQDRGLDRGAGRGGVDVGGAAGVSVRPAAHLLRHGARRPAARSGRPRSIRARASPGRRRSSPGVFVALWSLVGDAAETYDLTNIGTLFAFMLVSIGVLVLRYKEPERPRPFRVPLGVAGVRALGGRLPVHHERSSGHGVGAVRDLVDDRAGAVFRVRISSIAACAERTRPRNKATHQGASPARRISPRPRPQECIDTSKARPVAPRAIET